MSHWNIIVSVVTMKIQQSGAQNIAIFRLSTTKHWLVQVEFYINKKWEEAVATTNRTQFFSTKYLIMWFTHYNCA